MKVKPHKRIARRVRFFMLAGTMVNLAPTISGFAAQKIFPLSSTSVIYV